MFLKELFPLALIAIEYVQIYVPLNAPHSSIGTKLPEGKMDVGLVFSVAGYPHVVILLDIGGILHVFVDEHLVDIQDGSHVGAPFDVVHKGTDAPHQFLVATNGIDLCVGGFYVEHRWKVTVAEQRVIDEIGGLGQCWCL